MSGLSHRVSWRQIVVGGLLSCMALGVMACGDEEKKSFSGVLDDETTWEGDVVVSGDLTLTSKLTIEPCTTIRLGRGVSIRTVGYGEIHSVGTKDCPITFQPKKLAAYYEQDGWVQYPHDDSWGAVILDGQKLDGQKNVKHVIEHTHFKQGGYLNRATLVVEEDANVRVGHVLVEGSTSSGVVLDKKANVEAFSNVTFNHTTLRDGSSAMQVSMEMAGVLEGIGSDFPERERIFVIGEDELREDVVWKKHGIAYQVQGVHLEATLELEAGVKVLVGHRGGIIIGDRGSLRSIGTAEEPVVIESGEYNAKSGSWSGIIISPDARHDNLIEHTEIRHAQTAIAGLMYVGVDVDVNARLTVRNTLIEQISSIGIDLSTNVHLDELAEVHFKDIEGTAVWISYDSVGFINAISGEGLKYAHIGVSGAPATRDAVWKKHAFPYVLYGGDIRSHIEVDAGVRFMMPYGQFVKVHKEGSFSTHGTSAEPVVFVRGPETSPKFDVYFYGIQYYLEPAEEEPSAEEDKQASVLRHTSFDGFRDSSGNAPIEIYPTRNVTLDNVAFRGFSCDVDLSQDAEPPTVINTTYRLCD